MKKNIGKKLLVTILAAVTIVSAVLPSHISSAATYDVVDGAVNFNQGTASIIIKGINEQSLDGKKFVIYRLFDAKNAVGGESINYTFNETYKPALQKIVGEKLEKEASIVTEYEVIDYIQSLNTHAVEGTNKRQAPESQVGAYRYFVEELRDELQTQNLEGDTLTITSADDNNNFTISGLAYGYYLLDEITAVNGRIGAASLCMMTTANPTADMYVKGEHPTVDKRVLEKNNDTGEERSIRFWNDVADCEIGETVSFAASVNIPDINGYDTYYLAWHDVMDEALTFVPEMVEIAIEGYANTYILNPSEYVLTQNPDEDTTFRVEIPDIKAIIDHVFKELNSDGEQIYMQTVTLFYGARVNELAATKTGKPGIENDVRIEYSNDPDSNDNGSTGFSAWDTTACFTYKLNVTKENNHGRNLAGAKFKLFYDEACEEEIMFTETTGGYILNSKKGAYVDPENLDSPYMVSGADGTFTIYGLDSGTYYLKEIEAPDGYRLLEDPVSIYIAAYFSADRNHYIKGDGAGDYLIDGFEAGARIIQFVDGAETDESIPLASNIEDGSVNLTVVNTIGKKLPVTGSYMTIILIAAGACCMTIALTLGKRKEQA